MTTNWKRLAAWKERNALLDHSEKCLLHLLRNPPQSPVARLWERDVMVEARKLGYQFADRPAIGANCRPGIDRGITYGGDMEDVF